MAEWEITSVALIIISLLVRCLVKEKITLCMRYAMWFIVMIRLLVPFMVTDSRFSIMNYADIFEVNFEDNQKSMHNIVEEPYEKQPDSTYVTQKPQIQYADFQNKTESFYNNVKAIKVPDKKSSAGDILLILWLCGMIAGLMAVFAANIRFYRGLKKSRRTVNQDIIKEIRVYESKMVNSPCLFGIFKPCIYLNTVPDDKNVLEHILSHEYTHYRHFDYIWSFMRLICICIHWYNPFVWLAAYMSASDCELACDEGAIRIIGEENRIAYGETLIKAAAAVNGISVTLLGTTAMLEGKRSLKERVVCIAKKHMNSKTAVIALIVVSIIALLCTFTGMYDGLDVKKLEEKLIEAGTYDESIEYELFEADYNSDGRKDSFIVVFNEGKPENAEDETEHNVDIWYYDGRTGSMVNHVKDEYLPVSKEHMHIEELTDKTFFIYDVPYTVMWDSHVMGIRNGEVSDYFETVEGTFKSADGNDIEISIFPINAGSIDGMFYGRTVMPQYLYYDAESDMVMTYTAYAITRYEAEKIENVSEVLESIKNTYAEMERNYDISFAIRNDMLHMMIKIYTDEASSYYDSTYDCEYYTYRIENNGISELISQGDGFYDDIDEESENRVEANENEDMKTRRKIFETIRENYLSITNENIIYSSIREAEEGDSNSARLLYYILNVDYSISVREEYYTLFKDENGYSIKSSYVLFNETIKSAEDFARVYDFCPDLFAMGLTKHIINEGVSEFKTPESAAILFFKLSGGNAEINDTDFDNRKNIVYTFADGSQTEIDMYRTYDGIWLPFGFGRYSTSASVNEWYMSLTEKDFQNAVTYDEMPSLDWFAENVVILAEFPEYGVKIYSNGNCEAIIVDYAGERYLYSGYGLTPRLVLPKFDIYDYDSDGMPEIAVSEYYASGTGISIEGLSVIDSSYEMFDTIYCFTKPEAYINEKLEYQIDGENLYFGLKDREEIFSVGINDVSDGTDSEFNGIFTGDNISFEFSEDGNIRIYAGIEVFATNILPGMYLPDDYGYPNQILADVKYDGYGIFKMTNFRFASKWKEYKQ